MGSFLDLLRIEVSIAILAVMPASIVFSDINALDTTTLGALVFIFTNHKFYPEKVFNKDNINATPVFYSHTTKFNSFSTRLYSHTIAVCYYGKASGKVEHFISIELSG